MIFKSHFYHKHIKNLSLAFGTLFSDMVVLKYKSDGSEDLRVVVPITYAPKEKWVRRITEDQDLDRKEAITFPRMAYEMIDFKYDQSRKLNSLNKIKLNEINASSNNSSYMPVPYEMYFHLYVATKTQDEMFQIVEQIIPAFSPSYMLNLKILVEGTIQEDITVPVTLHDVTVSDSYEGSLEDRRFITGRLDFSIKSYIFPPIRKSNVIKTVDVDLKSIDGRKQYAELIIEPYIEGVPLSQIHENDNWSLKTTINEAFN